MITIGSVSLSALGGRICYSGDIEKEIKERDKRLYDPEEIRKYLFRVGRKQHYSIFAHTPVIIHGIDPDVYIKKGYFRMFKNIYDPETKKLKINLRHIIEWLGLSFLDNVIMKPLKLEKDLNSGFYYHIDKKMEWITILIPTLTRRTSHQFVRHQALNFNEKSLRYTKLDTFQPSPFWDSLELYKEHSLRGSYFRNAIYNSFKTYNKLLSAKIKPEKARDVLPLSTQTSILVSGYFEQWKNFLDVRTQPSAQGEINKIAKQIRNILTIHNIDI